MRNCSLEQIPPDVARMRNLTMLYVPSSVRSGDLTDCAPHTIALVCVWNVVTRDLSRNNFAALNGSVLPPTLEKLDLGDLGLQDVPEGLHHLTKLKEVYVPSLLE